MSTFWLRGRLEGRSNARTDGGNPILKILLDGGREERIYCPDSDEYRVTADVIDKAAGLGATVVAYSNTWCGVTEEGKRRAKEKGVSVITYAGLFVFLRRKGVTFQE